MQNTFERLRIAAGLTQSTVAVALGIDRSTVSKWETGKAFPRFEKLPVLARLLGCTIDDLYSKSQLMEEGK